MPLVLCRSKGVPLLWRESVRFVEYFLLLLFWRSVKKSTVWTSLMKCFKELEQIEVQLFTSRKLEFSFEIQGEQGWKSLFARASISTPNTGRVKF
jgi:hypothetical protein